MPDSQPKIIVPQHHHSPSSAPEGRIRVDKTINIANIITMVTIAFGIMTFSMRTYHEVFAEIARSQHELQTFNDRLTKVEQSLVQSRADWNANAQQLRGEIRQDLQELRRGVNELTTRLSSLPTQSYNLR